MRLVILANRCPPQQAHALSNHLNNFSIAWWRYEQNAWLVNDRQERGLNFWVERAHEVAPNARILVVKADASWNGWGETSDFEWMRQHWQDE